MKINDLNEELSRLLKKQTHGRVYVDILYKGKKLNGIEITDLLPDEEFDKENISLEIEEITNEVPDDIKRKYAKGMVNLYKFDKEENAKQKNLETIDFEEYIQEVVLPDYQLTDEDIEDVRKYIDLYW